MPPGLFLADPAGPVGGEMVGPDDGLIAALPIDDVAQRTAVEIGAQILAEQIDAAVAILVARAGDVRRNQYARIGP